MRPLLSVLFLTLLLPPQQASAQISTGLAWVAAIGVFVEHTEDGTTCRPNRGTLNAEAELILRRAGIVVDDDGQLYRAASDAKVSSTTTHEEKQRAALLQPHSLYISTVSVHIGGRCAVGRSIELARFETTELGALVKATYFYHSGVWSGPPHAVSGSMREVVQEGVTTLANDILKAKQGQ